MTMNKDGIPPKGYKPVHLPEKGESFPSSLKQDLYDELLVAAVGGFSSKFSCPSAVVECADQAAREALEAREKFIEENE